MEGEQDFFFSQLFISCESLDTTLIILLHYQPCILVIVLYFHTCFHSILYLLFTLK